MQRLIYDATLDTDAQTLDFFVGNLERILSQAGTETKNTASEDGVKYSIYINEDLNHTRKDNIKEFARGEVLIKVGENDYSATVIVGFTSSKQMLLYDIVDFAPTNIATKKRAES